MYNDPRAKDLLAQYPRQLAEGGAVDQPFQAPAVAPRGTPLPVAPANQTISVAPRQRPTLAPVTPTLSMSQQIARDRAFQDAMIRDAISKTGVANPTTMDYRQLQRAVRAGDITGENIKQKFVDPELEARVRNAYAAIGRTGGVVPTLEMPKKGGATADTYKKVRQDEYNYWADQLKQGKISPTDFQNAFLKKAATDIPTTDLEAQREYVNKARKALGMADLEMPKKKSSGPFIGFNQYGGMGGTQAQYGGMGSIVGPKIKPKEPKLPTKPIDLSGTGSTPVQLFDEGGEAVAAQDPRSMDLEQWLLDNSRTRLGPVDVQEVRSSKGPGKYDTRVSKNVDGLEAYADVDVGGKKLSQLGARFMGQGRIGNYEVQYMYDPETKQPVITGAVRKELSPTSDVSAEGVYVPQKDGKDYYNAGVRYTKRFEDGGPVNKKEVGHPNEYADQVARWGRKGQEGFANMIGLGEEVKFANAIPEFYFPKDEQLDGRGDAMRHMLLQAQIAKKYGRTPAEIASYIHENWLTGGQSDEEQAMDVANDARGMDIGLRSKDKADMAYQALQAIKSGQAKTIAKPKKPKKFEDGGEVTADDIARVNRESYLSPTGVAPEIGEVKPKYPALNAWSKGLEIAAAPFDKYALDKRIPLVGGMTAADFLGMNDTASLARDVSYGDPVVRGKNVQTSKIDPRLLAVADIVPVAGAAAKGASTLAKAGAKEVARQIETGTGVIGRNTMDPRMYAAEFYSPAARAVESHKMDKMPANQWMAWLNSNAPKAAKEELAQTEAGKWLKEQKGNVAKQDLLAVINESSPEILTKTMPQDTYAENAILGQKKARFGDFTLPGNNSNYREMTISVPFKEEAMPIGYTVSEMDYGKGDIKYFANTPNTRSQAFSTRAEAEADLQDSIVNLKDFRKNLTAYKVPSAHSYMDDTADTNRVAHVRMNNRQDRQGNSVLFIEEVQSDWAQQGRKEGFRQDFNSSKYNELKKQNTQMALRSKEALKNGNEALFDELHAKRQSLLQQLNEMENARYSPNPPKGPYVGDTKAWTGLALKKIIEDAVDKGYSSVAFTTGAQQNARYNLSRVIKQLGHKKNANGTYDLYTIEKGGRENSGPTYHEELPLDEISSMFGKEMAEKIKQGEGTPPPKTHYVVSEQNGIRTVLSSFNTADKANAYIKDMEYSPKYVKVEAVDDGFNAWTKLEGDGLEIGGRGMKGFYDEILPQAAKDVLKQLGVKPEIKQIDMRPKPTMFSSTSGIPEDRQIGMQWGFDITPELMNAVQQKGISKFKHGGEVTDFIKSKK